MTHAFPGPAEDVGHGLVDAFPLAVGHQAADFRAPRVGELVLGLDDAFDHLADVAGSVGGGEVALVALDGGFSLGDDLHGSRKKTIENQRSYKCFEYL